MNRILDSQFHYYRNSSFKKKLSMQKGELDSDCHLYSDSITIPPFSFFKFFSGFQPWLHVKISKILLPEILIKIMCAISQTWESFVASQVIPSATMVDRHYVHTKTIYLLPFHDAIKELAYQFLFSLTLFYLLCLLKSFEVSL